MGKSNPVQRIPPLQQRNPGAERIQWRRRAIVAAVLFSGLMGVLLTARLLPAVLSSTGLAVSVPPLVPGPALLAESTGTSTPTGTRLGEGVPHGTVVPSPAAYPSAQPLAPSPVRTKTVPVPAPTEAPAAVATIPTVAHAAPTSSRPPSRPPTQSPVPEEDYPPAPEFTLPDLHGTPVRLQDLRGHPVWINFWATWCPPCQVEMPEMQKIYTKYRDQGLIILGIDEGEDRNRVATFVNNGVRFEWTFLLDADAKVALRYEVGGLPVHAFVDPTGRLRGYQVGQMSPTATETMLARILPP